MCGIAGIFSPSKELVVSALHPMVAAISHRGPDDHGVFIRPFGTGWLGLGHRRLAILDLSPAGHQPMIRVESGSAICFNGEIYNFKKLRQQLEREGFVFRTQCDTELLLAWMDFYQSSRLDDLEGMFSFAWVQGQSDRLILARDHLGIKPLYYAPTADGFVFGSEIKSLMASGLIPSQLSRKGIAGYLAFGSFQQPLTLVEGIQECLPGCTLTFTPSDLSPSPVRYFCFPESRFAGSLEEAIQESKRLVEQAVTSHLLSDVPVGFFLSSGLDSTIIASIARRNLNSLRSFTVGFASSELTSEVELASQTAARLGIQHTNLFMTPSTALESIHRWLESLDQPSIDGLNVFVISQLVRREGVPVALSGLGADELFGGYPSFQQLPKVKAFLRRTRLFPKVLLRSLAYVAKAGSGSTVRHKVIDLINARSGDLLDLYLLRRRLFTNFELERLGMDSRSVNLNSTYQSLEENEFRTGSETDMNWAISRMETRYYQGNMLLRDADTNSMAHALELRVPFLDKRVVQFGLSLPGRIRMPDGTPKYLLRKAFATDLPEILLKQEKKGFTLPISDWLLGPLQPEVERTWRVLKDREIFRSTGLHALRDAFHRTRDARLSSRVLSMMALSRQIERYHLT